LREVEMRSYIVWVHFDQFFEMLDRSVILASHIVRTAEVSLDSQRHRVEFEGLFIFGKTLVKSALKHQELAQPMIRGGIVWAKLDRSAVFTLGSGVVKFGRPFRSC